MIDAVLGLLGILLINAAITTLIFAAIEIARALFPGKHLPLMPTAPAWSPEGLPPIHAHDDDKQWSIAKALAEVIFGYAFVAWLLLVPHYPFLLLGPGAWYLGSLPYKLAHAWWPFYWWVVVINGFVLAWKTVDLMGGAWQRRKWWRHWAMHILALIPLGILLAAPGQELFLADGPAANGAALVEANKGLHTGLRIAVAVVVLQLAWKAGRMGLAAYRKRVAAR